MSHPSIGWIDHYLRTDKILRGCRGRNYHPQPICRNLSVAAFREPVLGGFVGTVGIAKEDVKPGVQNGLESLADHVVEA